VGVDEAGQHREARQVDAFGIPGGGRNVGVRSDARDALASDEDALVGLRAVARAVDQTTSPHEHPSLRRALVWAANGIAVASISASHVRACCRNRIANARVRGSIEMS
jgi:hypothetical protein